MLFTISQFATVLLFCWLLFVEWLKQIAREVLDAAARVVRPGVTTDEIDEVVHRATIDAGRWNILGLLTLDFPVKSRESVGYSAKSKQSDDFSICIILSHHVEVITHAIIFEIIQFLPWETIVISMIKEENYILQILYGFHDSSWVISNHISKNQKASQLKAT